MVVLCIGPVCIPLHLLLPFLLTLAHQRGWLLFVKREWVTFRYWKERIAGKPKAAAPPSAQQEKPPQQSCGCAEAKKGPEATKEAVDAAGRRKED